MVLKRKKGESGNAASYTTRNQALVRLQIKLPEFRRLCILKGIHPREPKKKTKGNNKTYYHVKDINFLAHEPLLHLARDIKAHEKKIKRAKGRDEHAMAARLEKRKPKQSLDHLVKERYPSFIDALRDLDDALTLLHLFATLPADATHKIPAARVHAGRRLSLEWQAYITRTHALRKVFVSVKGYYFQSEVVGQQITWLVPHQLVQVIPEDVDFRVMLTFLEFHETLVGFVNFKLYHELGLAYPPSLDPRLERAAAELYAVMRELAAAALKQRHGRAGQRQVEGGEGEGEASTRQGEHKEETDGAAPMEEDAQGREEKQKDAEKEAAERLPDLRVQQTSSSMASLASRLVAMEAVVKARDERVREKGEGEEEEEQQALLARQKEAEEEDEEDDEETKACRNLFKGLVFYLAREVPREVLMFVIRSFGGKVTWEGEEAPVTEDDESITHQVVDRPQQKHRFLSRDYIQPQWVFDCANARILLPCGLYAPGIVPPPHLSPFVDHKEEGYLPDYAATIQRLKSAAAVARDGSTEGGLLEWEGARERRVEEDGTMVAAARFEEDEEKVEAARLKQVAKQEEQYAAELASELAGVPFSASLQEESRGEEGGNEAGGKEQGEEKEDGEDEDGELPDDAEEDDAAEPGEPGDTFAGGSGVVVGAESGSAVEMEQEAKEMARMLMTGKRRGLYDAMKIGNARKAAHVALLQKRKAAATSAQKGERGEGGAGSGVRAGSQGSKAKKRRSL